MKVTDILGSNVIARTAITLINFSANIVTVEHEQPTCSHLTSVCVRHERRVSVSVTLHT